MTFLANAYLAILASTNLIGQPTRPTEFTTASPPVIDAPVREVYPLVAEESDRNIQFVVETDIPACYRLMKPFVRVSREQKVILFHLQAVEEASRDCGTDRNSGLQVINIGRLPAGHYDLLEYKSLEKRGIISVQKRLASADPHAEMAEVESATIHHDTLGYRRLLTLTGFLTNTCAEWNLAEKNILKTSSQVIQVLPSLSLASRGHCESARIPFIKTFEIPDNIESGRYLFHLKTGDGKEFDQITSIEMDIERATEIGENSPPHGKF